MGIEAENTAEGDVVDKMTAEQIASNERIFAAMSHDELVLFIQKVTGGTSIGSGHFNSKPVQEVDDTETLRSLALALTQGL